MDNLELVSFQIISAVGVAKSSYIEAMKIAEKIKAKARLEIPIVEVDAGAMNQSTAFIKEKAENYEQKNVPGFLLDLVNFADEKRSRWKPAPDVKIKKWMQRKSVTST